MAASLFDQSYLNKLDRLQLLARRLLRSRSAGEHLALGKGVSLEFDEYRRYNPGDDFRLIDWNVFGRTERLFLKLFAPEQDLNVYLLLDTSGSMNYGHPPKIQLARQIAGSLGYIALAQHDRISLFAMAQELEERVHFQRSKVHAFQFFQTLQELRCEGTGRFNALIDRFMRKTLPGGLVVLLSDLLDEGGYDSGLKYLSASRFDVMVLHVLDPSEITPMSGGPLILVDLEGGGEEKVALTPQLREKYTRRMETYLEDVERVCRRQRIEYVRAFTTDSFEEVVLRYLRKGALMH
jgi:uncharacterized protein (DUF58 family)